MSLLFLSHDSRTSHDDAGAALLRGRGTIQRAPSAVHQIVHGCDAGRLRPAARARVQTRRFDRSNLLVSLCLSLVARPNKLRLPRRPASRSCPRRGRTCRARGPHEADDGTALGIVGESSSIARVGRREGTGTYDDTVCELPPPYSWPRSLTTHYF